MSNNDHLHALQPAAQIVPSAQYVATKTEDGFTESPNKRRKVNITAEQKQGLINNLQIERKLSPLAAMDYYDFAADRTHQLPIGLGNFVRSITPRYATYAPG